MNENGVVMLRPRRPHWWRAQPEVTLNGEAAGAPSPIESVIKAADRLSSGQTLSLRLGYEPELLYRILSEKGFEHWAERQENGFWRVDFRRLPARRA
ncbi:MAG: DUF2249 domain-containing protein [Elusimicrobia bacterium]|nr:DUF2249 domain-containing protein [Elusimicrobiota bacterium]